MGAGTHDTAVSAAEQPARATTCFNRHRSLQTVSLRHWICDFCENRDPTGRSIIEQTCSIHLAGPPRTESKGTEAEATGIDQRIHISHRVQILILAQHPYLELHLRPISAAVAVAGEAPRRGKSLESHSTPIFTPG